MSKVYSVRFFTEGGNNLISKLESNKYIPIPCAGDLAYFEEENADKQFIVKSVEFSFPASNEEEYSYDVAVIMEECK